MRLQLHVAGQRTQQAYAEAATAVDARELEQTLRGALEGEVRFDATSQAIYSTDASNYRQVPIGVVIPKSKEDVIKTMRICRAHGAPIVARGGGTALAGQTCNVAVVIDASKYLNRVLEIDPEQRTARIQPGVILDDLRAAAKKHGLTFGPDPATHNHCTLGGMIGNNSCGVHSVMAGRTADNVHELEIVTYDGEHLTVGPTDDATLERIIAEGGRRGEIYRRLRALRDEYAEEIRARFPAIPRRVSGYNLPQLLPDRGFNVARALVGSESTCVYVLEATVRLVPEPKEKVLVVLGYKDAYAAGDDVPRILEHKPMALEGIDHHLVQFMQLKDLHTDDTKQLPDGNGWLLVEFGGDSRDEAKARAQAMLDALNGEDDPPTSKLYTDHEEAQHIWEVRESGLGATAFVPNMPDAWPGWEDSAVAPDQVGNYLREFRKLLEEFDYEAALYGHFGDGCIHCRITFDLASEEGIAKYRRFIDRAADLVVAHGGSLSGEHGDGQSRAALLPKMYGEDLVRAFRAFKSIWDPDGRMNPGKVVDPYPPDSNLRLGTDYAPHVGETYFRYPDDRGSFERAALRCVGVGKCRRTDDAFMCPSYLATHDERDTTRGRARALFEMMRGELQHEGWRSEAVHEALDLCLGCKGCKKECPVNVDMATYKAEFHAHYYHHRLRPRHHYAMGHIGTWARLASIAPGVANFFGQAPGVSTVSKWAAGVDQERRLPRFAKQTFTDWFRRRSAPGTGQRVVLLPDAFNDHFFPRILQAATRVLEQLGFRVELPPMRLPAVRPLIHYGLLDKAKEQLQEAVRQLGQVVRDGTPLIGVEPSTISVYREEVHNLFPRDVDGWRVRENCMLLSEFLDRHDFEFPKLGGKAVFHAHCHQKAVLDPAGARNVLKKLGLEVCEPEQGCCGMAGSFGYEAGEHHRVSMQIAERHLLPAVRDAGEADWIIVEGFSCHEQIAQGAGREPLHFAEVVAKALEKS